MSVIRTLFLGTPEFARAHLEFLSTDEHYQIVGVVTQPDRPAGRHMRLQPSPVKAFALEKGYPVFTPEKITPEVLREWAALKAEVAVVVAYGQILPQSFLDLFSGQVVNVHASLLPRWRGAAPIQRAIMAGDKVTGVSLQVVTKKLDAGDVIGSYSLEITDDLDALDVLQKMIPLGQKLLHIDLMDYLRGNLSPQPQDESQVTYAHKIDKSESRLDLTLNARDLFNRIRGLVMGPGSYVMRQNKKLKLHRVQWIDGEKLGQPGEVIEVTAEDFTIACGEGALKIIEVQPESRPRMTAQDYLRGYPLKTGERFE